MDVRQQLTLVASAMTRDALRASGVTDAAFASPEPSQLMTSFSANGVGGSLATCPLFDLTALQADPQTLTAKVALEERLHAYGARDVVLWTPPGAYLPSDPDSAAAIVAEAAREMQVGSAAEVAFQVDVTIRKTGSDGSYMSVLGGLSQQWARFTNQVMGEYQLDSSSIHRLPSEESKITQMVDFLVLVANGIRQDGHASTVRSEDTWRLQRLEGLEEPIVICSTPSSAIDGRAIRRLLRRSLREANDALEAADGFRVAALITLAPSTERELVTTALRGMDPTLVAGWDYLPLLVDGTIVDMLEASPSLSPLI